jgi:ribosome maturation factor RimP
MKLDPAEVGVRARFFVSDDAVSQTSLSSEAAREGRIADLLAPALDAVGYELVRVSFGGRGRRTLQIMVERKDRATMTVDHCAEASGLVSDILDEADPIEGEFELEVSSPGLDRPLTRPDDYRRFAGLDARIELDEPIAGRRRFTGRLDGWEDGDEASVVLTTAEGTVRLPWRRVKKGKLVLNDALMAAARRWAEEGRSP